MLRAASLQCAEYPLVPLITRLHVPLSHSSACKQLEHVAACQGQVPAQMWAEGSECIGSAAVLYRSNVLCRTVLRKWDWQRDPGWCESSACLDLHGW